MRKFWRFILGTLSIIALLFGLGGMTVSIAGGFIALLGGALLWPSVGDRVKALLGKEWVAPATGLVVAFLVGPVVGVVTDPTAKEVVIATKKDGSTEVAVAGDTTTLTTISEEKQREAQEWWQNRQENLRSEHAREAREWEAQSQKDLKKNHRQCFDETTAYAMSKRFVEQSLKAPRTAKFPSFHADEVSVRGSGRCKFVVSAYVDSQNSFGAMRRTKYSIDMEYLPTEKTWRGSNLKM